MLGIAYGEGGALPVGQQCHRICCSWWLVYNSSGTGYSRKCRYCTVAP